MMKCWSKISSTCYYSPAFYLEPNNKLWSQVSLYSINSIKKWTQISIHPFCVQNRSWLSRVWCINTTMHNWSVLISWFFIKCAAARLVCRTSPEAAPVQYTKLQHLQENQTPSAALCTLTWAKVWVLVYTGSMTQMTSAIQIHTIKLEAEYKA